MTTSTGDLIDLSLHAAPFPVGLTVSPVKERFFAVDTYFDDAWRQMSVLLDDPTGFAHRHGLMVVKPDAVASGLGERILAWLEEKGFEVAFTTRLHFDRHLPRALWRYQWNMATPARRALQQRILTGTPSALVVVRRPAPVRIPTTVYLTDLKGPSLPKDRAPHHLRTALGSGNAILNFVHTADEPADVVREFGIYFDEEQRAACISEVLDGQDRGGECRSLLADLARAHRLGVTDGSALTWDEMQRLAENVTANHPGTRPLIRTTASDWGLP